MSDNVKVMRTVKEPDRLESIAYEMDMLTSNKIGLKMDKFQPKDIKQITEWMTKQKKPAEFVMTFDGDWVEYYVRVGTNKNVATEVSILGFINDAEKRTKIVEGLFSYGICTPSQLADFKKKHP